MRLLIVVGIAACVRTSGDEPAPDGGVAVADREQVARYHLAHDLDLARATEILLVRGRLDSARTLARAIAETPDDPHDVWKRYSVRLQNEAAGVAYANSLDDGITSLARMSKVCAECHASYEWAGLALVPEPAGGGPLARHVWAADQLWDGMIGNADEAWFAALDVYATVTVSDLTDRAELARRLQALAELTRSARWDSIDRRSTRYGDLLRACAACHAE